MSAKPILSPVLVLSLGVMAVATSAVLIRLAEAPALGAAFWRCALATLIMLPLGIRRLVDDWGRLSATNRGLFLASGFCLALHFATWIASLGLTSVASSTVLVATTPVWVAILGPLFVSDRLSRGTMVGIGVCLLGSVVIGAGDFHLEGDALLGDGLAIAGALTAGMYFILGRRLRRHLSILSYALGCYGMAAGFLLSFALMAGQPLLGYSAESYGWLLLLALVPQVIGHSSYNWALGYLAATTVAITVLAEPVFATLLAWWVLAEVPSAQVIVGAVIVLAGVAWALRCATRSVAPTGLS